MHADAWPTNLAFLSSCIELYAISPKHQNSSELWLGGGNANLRNRVHLGHPKATFGPACHMSHWTEAVNAALRTCVKRSPNSLHVPGTPNSSELGLGGRNASLRMEAILDTQKLLLDQNETCVTDL